ncbi:MAG: LysE family translocator [Duodenibacillus sp.]|nr:LysE family translocator [Duodenibacillus sp.]
MSGLFGLFLITSAANILTPGLGVIMIIMIAAEYGWKRTLWGNLGVSLGIAFLFVLAVSGLGVIVQTSPLLYAAIKCLGAAYLFWMGIKTFRRAAIRVVASASTGQRLDDKPFDLFVKCFFLSATNPQPMVFAISLLPQFIDPTLPYVPQVSVMIVCYTLIVFLSLVFYALIASRARLFLSGPTGAKRINQVSGTVFCLIGLFVLYKAIVELLPFLP